MHGIGRECVQKGYQHSILTMDRLAEDLDLLQNPHLCGRVCLSEERLRVAKLSKRHVVSRMVADEEQCARLPLGYTGGGKTGTDASSAGVVSQQERDTPSWLLTESAERPTEDEAESGGRCHGANAANPSIYCVLLAPESCDNNNNSSVCRAN